MDPEPIDESPTLYATSHRTGAERSDELRGATLRSTNV